MRSLRIAQLVLPWIPLPPSGYAGTERVVYNLTEELVRRGHEVTLFASGDSKTTAKLEAVLPQALGLQEDVKAAQAGSFYPLMHVAHCFELSDQFDIIHSHAQFLGLPFAAAVKTPSVHTFHRVYAFTKPDEADLVMRYKNQNFVSISNAQRIPGVNYIATVYNGVDTGVYKPLMYAEGAALRSERNFLDPLLASQSQDSLLRRIHTTGPQTVSELEKRSAKISLPPRASGILSHPTRDYLFWAGRIIDKKGPLEAILVAKALGIPLVMAGEVTERAYFEEIIKPHVDGTQIRLAPKENQAGMIALYQNAKVTIVPTKWNEPFGLVPVESMACGTPAVSYANGGVVETIADGTGYLVDEKEGVDGLAKRVKEIVDMSAEQYQAMIDNSRQHVLTNFSVESMVEGYERMYEKLASQTI